MLSAAEEHVPSDVLISRWCLDAQSIAGALHDRFDKVRLLLAGAMADDLSSPAGPAELVALTDGSGPPSRVWWGAGELPGCPVAVVTRIVSAGMLRAWSGPLLRVVTRPDETPPAMPSAVAAGLHAVYTQRDLVPDDDYLTDVLVASHAAALPLFVAATATHRLRSVAARRFCTAVAAVRLHVRALLAAWGYCNPDPAAMLPLLERVGSQLRLPTEVLSSVRQALSDPRDTTVGNQALRALSEVAAAEPLLRLCGGAGWPVGAQLAAAPAG